LFLLTVTKEREKENVLLKQQWLLSEFDDVVLFLPFHRWGSNGDKEVKPLHVVICIPKMVRLSVWFSACASMVRDMIS